MLGLAFEKLSKNVAWHIGLSWPEALRKRAIRYLLHRYVGQFLIEDLSLDQLTVDLSNGTGIIKDLSLDINSLNEAAEQLNLPFIFVDGFIGEILLNIPWRNLLNENCYVGISGLKLVLRPKQRDGDVSLVDSMIDSMSTSMQIAQECFSQVSQDDCKSNDTHNSKSDNTNKLYENVKESVSESNSIDAIEHFAKAIDTVLNKVKIRFTDSLLRLEYLPKSSFSGIGLDIKIDNIDYFDEAGFEKEPIHINNEKTPFDLSFTSKKLLIEGVSIFLDEFHMDQTIASGNESFYSQSKSVDFDNSEEEFHDTLNQTHTCSSKTNVDDKYAMKDFSGKSIIIAKLYNRQEIKIQLRKADSVSGPKVKFEINCGSLITFLSPRQIHLLLTLSEGISSPETIDHSETLDKVNKNNHQKPMNQSDFRTIERDLIKQVSPPNHIQSHALNHNEGWSSPPDNISDEEFFPFYKGLSENHSNLNPMTSSSMTDLSDIETSYTSTASSHIQSGKKDEVLTNFKVRLNSICLILLHDDIIIPSSDKMEIVASSSVKEMCKLTEEYFENMGSNYNCENAHEEFILLQKKAKDACFLSHLRFISTSIVADGTEKSFSNKWELKTTVSSSWCELVECLNESISETTKMISNNILEFKDKKLFNGQFQSTLKPNVLLSFNQSQRIRNVGKSRRLGAPKVEYTITLDECFIEVDLSLIDRLNTLFSFQEVLIGKEENTSPEKWHQSQLDNQAFFKEVMEEVAAKSDADLNVKIECPLALIKVFFPIPDLRSPSDVNRIPWWKQNVRKDVLSIEIRNFILECNFGPKFPYNYEILSNDIHIRFQENNEVLPISLLRASGPKGIEEGFDPIRIGIQSFPTKSSQSLDDEPELEKEDIMSKSMMGFLEEMDGSKADIFNKRKVASQHQGTINELTIPSDNSELNNYINETLKNVQFNINIFLSDVKLILPSKHIYEIVYNRLVSDLLLWSPSAPKKYNKSLGSLSTLIDDLSIGTTLIPDSYSNVGSSHFKAFNSLKSDGDKDYINGYTSIYDHNYDSYDNKVENKAANGQTFIGLQVKILNGVGTIQTPYRDETNKIIPGHHGDVSFKFQKGFMFIASGYKGSINDCQGCININKLTVYHKPCNKTDSIPISLGSDFSIFSKNINCVVMPCDNIYRMGGGNAPFDSNKDSLSITFKMNFDILKNEKFLEMAGGFFGLNLKYYMLNSSESWISQLGDMFNVEDYPIEGYLLPDVVTELNFNFQFCAIDYRPLHLPLKCYITIDSLAITSNITVTGSSSVLLLFIEDAGLFLSQNLNSKRVDLKNDYVCIVDLGVFELLIKVETTSSNIPIQEMLFSNNNIHVRTCSDSFKSFLELIIYLANEGDLIKEPIPSKLDEQSNEVVVEPICKDDGSEDDTNEIYHSMVANMMKEAMMEPSALDKTSCKSLDQTNTNVDMFYFPDENTKSKEKSDKTKQSMKLSCQVEMESALQEALKEDFSDNIYVDNNQGTDEEFCVLDDIPGTGIKSPSGKPRAKHIKHNHVSIKDDYFDPSSSNYDAKFNTPNHFPKPHTKYNLQEMSIVWHMYGGKDFSYTRNNINDDDDNGNKFNATSKTKVQTRPHSPKNHVKFQREPNVCFTDGDTTIVPGKTSPSLSHTSPTMYKPNANMKWHHIGGINRCHDTLIEVHLSKISFKYEIYPSEYDLESRHNFAVNDIEIRDRLMSSKINKFLYQFSSECFPKQASSNMVQIKAISKKCDPVFKSSETNLNISVRPIRLNIDQDTLIFICEFIENIVKSTQENEYAEEEKPSMSISPTPVMTVNCDYGTSLNTKGNFQKNESMDKNSIKNSPIYFRNIVFSPDVPVRIDYHGKHIDINSQYGALAGLIIGLGHLDHSEVTLKRVEFKSGVLGVSKLITALLNEWINDVRKNQLPSILGGVGPMHSFIKLFGGLKDLIWLPIEQYNKDGRVIRGLQRGTSAFTSSSAYAVLDLTGRFVGCIQATAETMYDMVSSGPSVRNKAYKTRKGQPKDIREGVTAAFGLVRNGLGDTASTIMKVATEEHSHKGVSGAVGGVLRQIPPSVVQPIIIASEATCTVIGGMTNQLVPDAGKEAAEKWKS